MTLYGGGEKSFEFLEKIQLICKNKCIFACIFTSNLSFMAKDKIHVAVKEALIREGWIITHDPYKIKVLGMDYEIDLGAEEMIAAEQGGRKIAIEIKSFVAGSFVYEFHAVLGQFLNYELCLREQEPERILFLAIPDFVYETFFQRNAIQMIIKKYSLRLIIFDTHNQSIREWIQT